MAARWPLAGRTAAALRAFLKERLPEFMVPAHFIAAGRVSPHPQRQDRPRAPAAPAGGDALPADDDLPRTETEQTLARSGRSSSSVERIGVGEDVLHLGAHSLLAMRALSQIHDAFDVHVPTRNLFEHPTVAGLAGVIDRLTLPRSLERRRRRRRGARGDPFCERRRVPLRAAPPRRRGRDRRRRAALQRPRRALTPELRDRLKERKTDILDFLRQAKTLAAQARAIVPLQSRGTGVPVFAVPGHNGDVFCYRLFARHFPRRPFFGLQPPGLDGATGR